jgi:hypothetical protein
LSANDVSFGVFILSKQAHDMVFQIYANTLGVDPSVIPGMIAGACALDSLIVLAIAAFKWRASWWPQTKEMVSHYWSDEVDEETIPDYAHQYGKSGRVHPAE